MSSAIETIFLSLTTAIVSLSVVDKLPTLSSIFCGNIEANEKGLQKPNKPALVGTITSFDSGIAATVSASVIESANAGEVRPSCPRNPTPRVRWRNNSIVGETAYRSIISSKDSRVVIVSCASCALWSMADIATVLSVASTIRSGKCRSDWSRSDIVPPSSTSISFGSNVFCVVFILSFSILSLSKYEIIFNPSSVSGAECARLSLLWFSIVLRLSKELEMMFFLLDRSLNGRLFEYLRIVLRLVAWPFSIADVKASAEVLNDELAGTGMPSSSSDDKS